MATHTRQKMLDDDLRNDRNEDLPGPLASQPRPGAHPGPGHDREAVRRGEASQQTDNGPLEHKPARTDQAAHSNRPKDDRQPGS